MRALRRFNISCRLPHEARQNSFVRDETQTQNESPDEFAFELKGASGGDCPPISVPATPPSDGNFAKIATCPDRVAQFIKSNASLNKLSNIGSVSPNRSLWAGSLPTDTNPDDNQRFQPLPILKTTSNADEPLL
jgi:hypothetical protein